jgi:MFS family permease
LSFGVPSESLTRDIWLICLSNVIGAFGEGLYFWVFPIYVRSLQADYVQLGLVLSALSGVSALAPLPGGFLADRFDRKKILIIAWIPWVLAPLIYSFAENWILLIPGTVCWGVSMIGVPAANAYIITAVEDKRKLASVFSFVWSSYSFSYIFAPTVGGYLATIIGMRSIFYIATLLTAAATGVFLFLHSQHPPKQTIDAQRPLTLSNDTRRHWRSVLVWSAFFAFTAFFVSVGRAFIPTFLNEEIKLSEFYVGLFGSVNFAGITFIGIAMGRLGDRWRKSGAIGVCLFLYGMAVLPLMLIREPVVLMFDAFLLGSFAAISTLVGSHVGSIAPENKRGLWTSIPLTMSLLAGFAAPFLTGYLYTLSPYYGFIVSIGAMPLLIFFALTKLKA